MFEDDFYASLANSPEAAACIAAVLEHFNGYGQLQIHFTGANDGDIRFRKFNQRGKQQNIFTAYFARSRGYFSCKIYNLPNPMPLPQDGPVQHVRNVADPLTLAFNLDPTIHGAAQALIDIIEFAIASWDADNP